MSAGRGRGRIVVIGVGNPFRRDDGAGPAVTALLRLLDADSGSRVQVCELDGEPARLVEVWDGAALAVLVDATSSGAVPGAVRRFELGVDELPPGSGAASTHAIGLTEAVDLGRALGRLPDRLVVFGIEGAAFGPGPGLTDAVAASVDRVAAAVREEIAAEVAAPIGGAAGHAFLDDVHRPATQSVQKETGRVAGGRTAGPGMAADRADLGGLAGVRIGDRAGPGWRGEG
jgi:hydrogenase maturation protease